MSTLTYEHDLMERLTRQERLNEVLRRHVNELSSHVEKMRARMKLLGMTAAPKKQTIPQLMQWVSEETGIAVSAMLSPVRWRPVVRARWMVMYLARRMDFGLAQIGRELNQHHTTVMYGVGEAARQYELDEKYRERVDRLLKAIGEE